ncbi:high light inducible protein [Synechococcus phage syn9]|uniref:High light inducible protein n=1 Tax=Synechococcus phage syn9 TaxID=382359 RepID=Q0QZ16_BPSYS|nr:high light inducible protein [Synechococcus phage syn9]ABA47179.1 high light inducible protein [Synechococcus phage syn9]AGH56677.1 high light inducible protein [Cyanophage Syn10]
MVSSEVTIMFNEKAEKLNGRAAMIGFIAAVGAYFTTGQVIPGVW